MWKGLKNNSSNPGFLRVNASPECPSYKHGRLSGCSCTLLRRNSSHRVGVMRENIARSFQTVIFSFVGKLDVMISFETAQSLNSFKKPF